MHLKGTNWKMLVVVVVVVVVIVAVAMAQAMAVVALVFVVVAVVKVQQHVFLHSKLAIVLPSLLAELQPTLLAP